jgi:hypothetical protein
MFHELIECRVEWQVALPEWVRGRGLAMYVTVMFGALTLGSAIWGQLAVVAGLPAALLLAALGAAIAIPLSWRWKLQTGANVDFSPSMQWPDPVKTHARAAEMALTTGAFSRTLPTRLASLRPSSRTPGSNTCGCIGG